MARPSDKKMRRLYDNFEDWRGQYFWECKDLGEQFVAEHALRKWPSPVTVLDTQQFTDLVERRAAAMLVYREKRAGGTKALTDELHTEAISAFKSAKERAAYARRQDRKQRVDDFFEIVRGIFWLGIVGVFLLSAGYLLLAVM